MFTPRTTHWVILGTIVALSLYDLAARIWGGPEATISRVIDDWANRYPAVAFLAGCLVGHLFLGMFPNRK